MHEYGITPKTYTPHSVRDGFEAQGPVETPLDFTEMLARYGPYITMVFALAIGGSAGILIAS